MLFWNIVSGGLQIMAALFVFAVGIGVLAVIAMYLIDRTQTEDAIRRNYPVLGRFRDLFTELGEFFRQYFFAMDREELPFNRAQRNWVARAVRGGSATVAFGSTRNLSIPGTQIFANAAFPVQAEAETDSPPMIVGAGCRTPYEAPSVFNISAMSYGSLSKPAIRALSAGAKQAGVWLNTGEGGLSDWHLEGGCDVVFQIGTAKYGVRDGDGNLSDDKLREVAAHEQVRMFEIKLSQGAKPGKGGILPGGKVTREIARVRGIPEGEDSISPNRHDEVENVADLLDLIARVREVTGKPTGFKAVIGDVEWLRALFAEVRLRGADAAPDFIALDSGDGGTGAAPMPLMDLVGLTIRESLPQVADLIAREGMRDRVRLIAAGKLVTPGEVAWALAAGADFVVSARGFMFSIGCIQAMKCDRNTCPTGITTHRKDLQRGLVPEEKAEGVAAYAKRIRKEVEIIAHSCGAAHARDLTRAHVRIVQPSGRTERMQDLWPPEAR